MVRVLDFRLSGLSSSPSQGHCAVFLGKLNTLYSHSASLSWLGGGGGVLSVYFWERVRCWDSETLALCQTMFS